MFAEPIQTIDGQRYQKQCICLEFGLMVNQR